MSALAADPAISVPKTGPIKVTLDPKAQLASSDRIVYLAQEAQKTGRSVTMSTANWKRIIHQVAADKKVKKVKLDMVAVDTTGPTVELTLPQLLQLLQLLDDSATSPPAAK